MKFSKLFSNKVWISKKWNSFVFGEQFTKSFTTVISSQIDDFFENKLINKTIDFQFFEKNSEFSSERKFLLKSFLKKVNSDNFTNESVASAIEFNEIRLFVDFKGEYYSCNDFFSPHNGINVLVFKSSSKAQLIFIIQHVSSCDAIFIPELNLIQRFGHVTVETSISSIKKVFLAYLKGEFIINGKRKFGGVTCFHGRPYHFYYDVAIALRSLYQDKLLQNVPKFIQLEGSNFASVSKIFQLENTNKDILIKPGSINKEANRFNEFYFHTGYLQNLNRHKNLLNAVDHSLLIMSRKYLYPPDQANVYRFLKTTFPVIWIGVTGQKRRWLEQDEALSGFINELHLRYPDMCVVFDGWTSPETVSEIDKKNIILDNEVVKKIHSRINKKIKTLNIVGLTSLLKLKVAERTHFFVANQATGSMHVCRIAKKVGITHISKSFYETTTQQHVLETAIKFPVEKITDVYNTENPRMDFTNYSINKDDFLSFAVPKTLEYIERQKG